MNLPGRLLSQVFKLYFGALLQNVRTEAAAAYVGFIIKVRSAFLALLGLILLFVLGLGGFVLVHVALFVWLPWSMGTKCLVLLILGGVYLVTGLAAVISISRSRTWMKLAGVDKLLSMIGTKQV